MPKGDKVWGLSRYLCEVRYADRPKFEGGWGSDYDVCCIQCTDGVGVCVGSPIGQ